MVICVVRRAVVARVVSVKYRYLHSRSRNRDGCLNCVAYCRYSSIWRATCSVYVNTSHSASTVQIDTLVGYVIA
jgi:hypothetical protein